MQDQIEQINSVFEQPWWLNAVAGDEWKAITIEENNEIVARWPYVIKKGKFLNQIKMPKLTQTLGIWIKPFDGTTSEMMSWQKKIILNLINKLPQINYLKIHLHTTNNYFLPFIWKGFIASPCVTYKIKELTDLQKVSSRFDKTAKKNIKSAEKKVQIVDNLDIDVLIEMMEITFKAQNRSLPYNPQLIRRIDQACKEKKAGKFLAAVDADGNVHACSYFVFDENTYYYLISGSNPEFRTSGAQSLIVWEAIKHAATVSKEFDFEGSMIEPIEKFFRQFGGSPYVYYQIRKLPFLFEIFELLKPRIKKILNYK